MKLPIYLYNKSDDFMNVKLRHFQVKNNIVGNTGANLTLYTKNLKLTPSSKKYWNHTSLIDEKF